MIQGLLLAAGQSRRFGGQKLLTKLPNSQAIALASAIKLRSAVDRVSIVVSPAQQPIVDLFSKEHLSLVACPQSRYGIGHSIACGVKETKDALGWVIALGDMPFIKTQTIEAVVTSLTTGALIAVPVCHGRRGHPVGFSQHVYDELIRLNGDTGGKDLISRFESDVVEVPCQDPGIFIDIDTPEDLEKCSQELGCSESYKY